MKKSAYCTNTIGFYKAHHSVREKKKHEIGKALNLTIAFELLLLSSWFFN